MLSTRAGRMYIGCRMPNMVQDGMAWLHGQLVDYASSSVTYARGNASVTFPATISRQRPRDDGEQGNSVYGFETRMTFARGALVLSGSQTLPERGDTVTFAAGGVTQVYDVLATEGERFWRDYDAFGLRLEIKLKQKART